MAIDRGALAESVRPIAEELERLAPQLLAESDSPPAGSWIDQKLSSGLNLPSDGGFPIVREALVAAMYATLSGVDHAKAWSNLIRSGTATVSLATTARGALEGLAKAYAILGAPDTRTLISRHIAITEADLKFPLRYSQFQDHTGRVLNNGHIRNAHVEIASKLALGKLQSPSAQDMVQDLLRPGTRNTDGVTSEIYSQLSGPAHAAMSALGMYATPEGGRFILPRQIAEEQTAYIFAGTSVVADAWLNSFEAGPDQRGRWNIARCAAQRHLPGVSP